MHVRRDHIWEIAAVTFGLRALRITVRHRVRSPRIFCKQAWFGIAKLLPTKTGLRWPEQRRFLRFDLDITERLQPLRHHCNERNQPRHLMPLAIERLNRRREIHQPAAFRVDRAALFGKPRGPLRAGRNSSRISPRTLPGIRRRDTDPSTSGSVPSSSENRTSSAPSCSSRRRLSS